MKFDLLVAEIGSTTTVVTAFDNITTKTPKVIGQAEHYTTVKEGDVTIGIFNAIKRLENKLKEKIKWEKFIASSSAAGGLKITVHGLVYDMTVRAAREAALGAGGVLKYVTSGKMRKRHLDNIQKFDPKMILLAGGVDYGEEDTILHNAELISDMDINVPIVYAGNSNVAEEAKEILEEKGKQVIITENVYPKVDQLNVQPARRIIQELFSKNIIHAPGMEKIYDIVDEEIIPTPGSVMLTSELLAEEYDDVLVVDIGGATTDVDSVTEGEPEIQKILLSPEPVSKRTVEGDMGLFVNAENVYDMLDKKELENQFPNHDELIKKMNPYPGNEEMENFTAHMARKCFSESIIRHSGSIKYLFGPNGRQKIAQGKDLTAIKYIFGTGGILTRSRHRDFIMNSIKELDRPNKLVPGKKVKLAYDKYYIFAALGVLSTVDKQAAKNILLQDIEWID
ncbi:MAG: GlmL-related ornithine degradation protein [Thermotogota bacterium]